MLNRQATVERHDMFISTDDRRPIAVGLSVAVRQFVHTTLLDRQPLSTTPASEREVVSVRMQVRAARQAGRRQ